MPSPGGTENIDWIVAGAIVLPPVALGVLAANEAAARLIETTSMKVFNRDVSVSRSALAAGIMVCATKALRRTEPEM